MNTIYLSIIASLFWQLYSNSEQACPRGHRVATTTAGLDVCAQCEEGVNYQSDNDHKSRKCYNCSQVENPNLEITVTKCNITHNTQILCRPGYYRYKARTIVEKDRCEKCTECRNFARNCEGYNNTVCCLSNHDAVVVNDVVFKCRKTSITCGVGQYMNPDSSECTQCQEGLFMSDSNHTNNQCRKCAALSNEATFNSKIVRKCHVSSPSIFGCKDGYYRDDVPVLMTVEVKCLPCRNCLREARKCDMYHNAVCDKDNVTIDESEVLEQVADSKNIDVGFSSTLLQPLHIFGCTNPLLVEVQHDLYLCFIDYTKAFDKVRHDMLINSLQKINIKGKDLRIIKHMYWEQTAAVRIGTHFPPICRDGYYLLINDDGSSICKHCSNATSTSAVIPTTNPNHSTTHHNWTCFQNVYNTHNYGGFRVYSIVLFILAILVDILYVFLYSRTFLKKVSVQFPKKNSHEGEQISRMFGTVCLDVHFVFIFIHLFGILCEASVINMSEDTLWAFTVAVGTISLIVYIADAILLFIVKRVLSMKTCFLMGGKETRRRKNQFIGDDMKAIIDSTEV